MRLCARALPRASDALDTDTREELASLPEPELVFCERERAPCPRSSSWAAPKARSPAETSPPKQQAHLLPHCLPLQPLLLQLHQTSHPQARPRFRLAPHKLTQGLGLTFRSLGHSILASNDHTTRFWERERPGDAASVFSPGCLVGRGGPGRWLIRTKTTTTACLSFLALAGPQAQHGEAPPVSWEAREAVRVLAWTTSCPDSATGRNWWWQWW